MIPWPTRSRAPTEQQCAGYAEGKSRNQIARELGRGAATVSKIAATEGVSFSGGARVASATDARRADAAVRRE